MARLEGLPVTCGEYQRLDAFRKSQLARVVYFGQRVKEYGPVVIIGKVTRACSDETDGDCTFDVESGGAPWHMEVIPCAPERVRAAARALQVGDRVRVAGTKRWDPPHIFGGFRGKWEVHPVSDIERL